MSRDHYDLHIKALSDFAGEKKGGRIKTLFSCRIDDFSPTFLHQRLALLSFNRHQIALYLSRYLPTKTPFIDGEYWKISRLVYRLTRREVPFDPSIPFQLWLFSLYITDRNTWPDSHVDLLDHFIARTFQRKYKENECQRMQDSIGIEFTSLDICRREWGRIAYKITENNHGSAIDIGELGSYDNGDSAHSINSAIYVGKRCGFLLEAIEGQPYLIRFENHRLQEFFTAQYLRDEGVLVNWLERLDAPRWQETMINLVVMGGGDDAVKALCQEIEKPVGDFTESEKSYQEAKKAFDERKKVYSDSSDQQSLPEPPLIPHFESNEELLLADRIVLAVRILARKDQRQTQDTDVLRQRMKGAVELMAVNGNPITQVKMMHACQNLPDIDILKALEKPLRSRIHWVRSQVYTLLASAREGTRALGSDLPAEMAYDIATSLFLARWFAYLKAVIEAGSARIWWCFVWATVTGLSHFVMLLAISALYYLTTWLALSDYIPLLPSLLPTLWVSLQPNEVAGFDRMLITISEAMKLFDTSWFIWLVLSIVVVAALYAIAKKMPNMWKPVCITTIIAPLTLSIVVPELWKGELSTAVEGALLVMFAFLFGSWVTGLSLVAQQLSILLYLGGTVKRKELGKHLLPLSKVSWSESEFLDAIDWMLASIKYTLFLGLLIGINWILLHYLGISLSSISKYGVGGILLLLVFFKLIYLIVYTIRTYLSDRNIIYKVLPYIFGGVVGWGGYYILWHFEVLPWVGTSLAYLILVIILILLVYRIMSVAKNFVLMLLPWLHHSYFSNSFTPEVWKKRLETLDARGQALLFVRTKPDSLGLDVASYLAVLMEVEQFVREDPACSAYWDQRNKIEKALSQEQKG